MAVSSAAIGLGLFKKYAVFAQLAISAAVLYIAVQFAFRPALARYRTVAEQIRDKRKNLSEVQKANAEFKQLQLEIEQESERIGALKLRLVWEKDISRFLSEITKLAAGLQVEFVALKPEEVSTELPFKQAPVARPAKGKKGPAPVVLQALDFDLTRVPISITMRSSYNDLIKFLSRIEQLDKYIAIDSFKIESDKKQRTLHNVKLNLVLFQ